MCVCVCIRYIHTTAVSGTASTMPARDGTGRRERGWFNRLYLCV